MIFCSDIATASIGPRSTVATGPEELKDAKWELEEDTERFIQTAEVRSPVSIYASCCTEHSSRVSCRLFPTRGQLTMFWCSLRRSLMAVQPSSPRLLEVWTYN